MNSRNIRIVAAIITLALSYLATYALVLHLLGDNAKNWAWLVALGVELTLFAMKEMLFDTTNAKDDYIGWAGLFIDTVTNAAGAFIFVGRLFTYPPIASLMSGQTAEAVEVSAVAATQSGFSTQALVSIIVSLVIGLLLSVGPHRLWRSIQRSTPVPVTEPIKATEGGQQHGSARVRA